jgi:hypothetical protein
MLRGMRSRPLLGLGLSFLVALVSCSGSSDPCGEPLYEGGATDEAWRTMVDGEQRAEVNATKAPTFATPSQGQVFDKSDPAPRFSWASPLAKGPAPQSHRRDAQHPFLERILSFFVSTAHAHAPPVTGDVYYLQIDIPGQSCPLRVLTTQLEWQVDDESWDLLKAAAGKTLSVRILSAYLTENRITEGPYQPPAATTFQVR